MKMITMMMMKISTKASPLPFRTFHCGTSSPKEREKIATHYIAESKKLKNIGRALALSKVIAASTGSFTFMERTKALGESFCHSIPDLKVGAISLTLLLMFMMNSSGSAQEIPIVTFDELQPYLQPKDDKIYVINFWATWCKPCIEEMPYFEKLHQNYKDKKVRVLLVSLDFKSQYEKKLVPWVKKQKLQSQGLLLDTQGNNDFIDKVNPQWSGAIPATVIIHAPSKTNLFFEKQMTYEELEKAVQEAKK